MYKENGKDIVLIRWRNKIISAIYTAGKQVYSMIRSCFGNGYWVDDAPWDDNETWVD